MCLRWIALHLHKGCRVLDYGCGSGILAIGAALCGAAEVDAVDIDADAVTAAQANALANQVSINTGLPDVAQGQYGLVVANILAAPLKVLAPLLCAHVVQGGQLLLAGILSRQIEEIQHAYAPFLQLQVADTQDGWVLMTA
jgi:ribosomal protein L11 methyltransferase